MLPLPPFAPNPALYNHILICTAAGLPLWPFTPPPPPEGYYIYLIGTLLFGFAAQRGQSFSLSKHIGIGTNIGTKRKVASVGIMAYAFVLVWHGLAVVWPQATHTHALHIDLRTCLRTWPTLCIYSRTRSLFAPLRLRREYSSLIPLCIRLYYQPPSARPLHAMQSVVRNLS